MFSRSFDRSTGPEDRFTPTTTVWLRRFIRPGRGGGVVNSRGGIVPEPRQGTRTRTRLTGRDATADWVHCLLKKMRVVTSDVGERTGDGSWQTVTHSSPVP